LCAVAACGRRQRVGKAARPKSIVRICTASDLACSTTRRNPGWIYRRGAVLHSPARIRISGGEVAGRQADTETHLPNTAVFEPDLQHPSWLWLDQGFSR